MASSTTSLLDLPPELLLEITRNLPPDGILALRFTHPLLYDTLPFLPQRMKAGLSDCARLAIRTYLSLPDANPSHTRCIRCKEMYPTSLFYSGSSPLCMTPSRDPDQEVIALPQRFCAWHVGSFIRVIHTKPGGKNEWTANNNTMCMHCGAVKEWRQCDCCCDSCWYRAVTTYTRYLDNNKECRNIRFWRNTSSATRPASAKGCQLLACEACYDPGKLNIHYF